MKEYNEIGKLLVEIENTRGTKEKTRLLREGLEKYPKLEKVLQHLYDPQYVTGISKTSFYKSDEHGIGILLGYDDILHFLKFLHENNSGKDSTVQLCREVQRLQNTEEAKKLVYWLTTKDINIGISRGTVEKLVKIPKFEIMLGVRPELDEIDWDRQFILTRKLDGVNLTCFKRGDSIIFFTRQGKIVEGLENLIEDYKKLPDGVYFGEAIYDGESKDRKELYRLSAGELQQKKDRKKILHYVFDYTTLEEWDSDSFVHTYGQQFFKVQNEIEKANLKSVKNIPLIYMGTSKEEAINCLNIEKEKGEEGLVLRYVSSVYQKKRSDDFIKLKPFITLDLRVIDFKEFKHPGKLGALVVDYKGCPVSVGSGYSLEQRDEFWNKRNELIGKIIEVQTMEETEDKSGKKSLRFPVFLRIRDDKDEPSYS